MSKHFGKTWWGQQWLKSLSNIDYSNRLPRGSAYARKGSVVNIVIEGNTIKSKVKGSRPSPYKVQITIPPFSADEIKKLIKAVAKKPAIISKLLNRELEPELLKIAEEIGLKIFPNQWSDLIMDCSCPDWAVPCKHLAAVIYKVSSEIDNNPFLVFQLHRVDLPKALQEENIYIPPNNNEVPWLRDELITPFQKKPDSEQETKRINDISFQTLNFSTLKPIADPLIRLLADAPVFYPGNGNFREKYATGLQRAVRNAQRIIEGKVPFHNFFSELHLSEKPASGKVEAKPALINHHTSIQIFINGNNEVRPIIDHTKYLEIQQLIPSLWLIPPSHLQDYQPSVAILRTALLMGLNLLANGAVVPKMVKLDDETYAIRWLPALLSKEVRSLTDHMDQLLANDILLFKEKETTAGIAGSHFLAVFLGILVHRLSENKIKDLFLDLFFSGHQARLNDPGQEALAGGINTWLQRYYLSEGIFKPAIIVEELQDELFQVNVYAEEKNKPFATAVPLYDVLTSTKFDKNRFEILRSVAQLSFFIPGLDHYINIQGEIPITMNTGDFGTFLMDAIPALQLLNVKILLPKSLQQILKPKASVRIKKKNQDRVGFLRLEKLLDFDWQVAIGNTVMSELEFKKLIENSEGLIRYKANYLYVSPADLEKLHRHFASSKRLTAFEMLRSALSEEYNGAKISLTEEVKTLISQLTQQAEVPLPSKLHAQLRPYQQRGFSWMYRNSQLGFGSVLADDMGLGKTLQVITILLKYQEIGALEKDKAIIVAPTGLLTNWLAEFEKFAPSLKCKFYHGTGRKIDEAENFDVLLTSYGVIRSEAAEFKKLSWGVLAIDEAQNIKNPETAQSKAIKSIPAQTFIAMSGTPVENRLSELWSIMDFCNRGFLGGLKEFNMTYANPIQNQNDWQVAHKLKAVTAPFLMRRLKSDKSIISDLPEKIEIDSYGNLAKEQASLYEKTLQNALQTIENITASDKKSLFVRQGLVLQMILALKQICNHPTQFLKNKVLDASLSGKMELLFDKLENIVEANEKVLIFSQFTEMGHLLQHFISEHFGEAPLFYHGNCSVKKRKEIVDSFQNNRADKILILSLKAAGTGLNLTAANHVIHYDLWWNPAVEAQATDRAYRIGQKNKVMVHRFITKGTFEERINDLIQNKKALANMTVATGENWIGNLSNNELKEIFQLG